MTATARGKLDPDELAMLEEERDHLLCSLYDLESEFAAGDMDEVDYLALKDDYTVRAAEVLRAIDERRSMIRRAARTTGRGRTVAVVVGVLAFAALAGVLVARGSGQRGGNAITGSTGTLRERLATCQTTSFQEPAKGVTCYDKILDEAPENLEALTYQGWAYVRDDRVAEGTANFDKVIALDPSYADVRVFRASVASKAEDFAAAADELDQFYANDPSPAAVQVLQSQGLERNIFFGLLDADTRDCWELAAAGQETAEFDQDFLDTLGTCLDQVLATSPDDSDALVSRAISKVGPDSPDAAGAVELVDRAVRVDPTDANALLLSGWLANSQDRNADAQASVDALAALPRATISFLIGDASQLATAIENAAASTTTSAPSATPTTAPTTTAPTRSTLPGTPSIPNASGG
ncbi:hypothetical protein BH10ACT3_BH10ACT3_13810 [soil metagenome]